MNITGENEHVSGWLGMPAKAAIGFFEIAKAIGEHADANKKIRIVLEYDPKAVNARLLFVTEVDEHNPLICPEPPKLAYPQTNQP